MDDPCRFCGDRVCCMQMCRAKKYYLDYMESGHEDDLEIIKRCGTCIPITIENVNNYIECEKRITLNKNGIKRIEYITKKGVV